MYNEELEKLIDAALADGVLTEKEKQVLYKKAQAMGVDLDEFEMVLDARLFEKQKQDKEAKEKSTASPKSNKMGEVKKCPACGSIVSSYQVKCTECGYEFSDLQANLSSQKLADMLEEATRRFDNKQYSDDVTGLFKKTANEKREEDIENEHNRMISAFPIPSTKADLLEFLTYLRPKAENNGGVYEEKYQECISKAKVLFHDDPMFKPLFEADKEKEEKEKKESRTLKIVFVCMAIFVVVSIVLGIIFGD